MKVTKKQDIEAVKKTIRKYNQIISELGKSGFESVEYLFLRHGSCAFCLLYFFTEIPCEGCPVNYGKEYVGCVRNPTLDAMEEAFDKLDKPDFIKHTKTRIQELKNML